MRFDPNGCSHGVKWTDKCEQCEAVSIRQEIYDLTVNIDLMVTHLELMPAMATSLTDEAFDLAKAITSFEVWTENRCKTHAELNEYRTHLCKEVWVAAKQESEKEIASLVKAISLAADAREAALENTLPQQREWKDIDLSEYENQGLGAIAEEICTKLKQLNAKG